MHRRMIDHPIVWNLGAEYTRLWTLIVFRAQHSTTPTTLRNGVVVNRGQFFSTYGNIAKQLPTKKGRGYRYPSSESIRKMFRVLLEAGLVAVLATGGGILVSVSKYETWQAPEKVSGRVSGRIRGTVSGRQDNNDNNNAKDNNQDHTSADADIRRVFDAFKSSINPKGKLTKKARAKIATRLIEFSASEIIIAIGNWAADDWQRSNNHVRGLAWFCDTEDRVNTWINKKPDATANGHSAHDGDDAPFDFNAYKKARDESLAKDADDSVPDLDF